MFWSCPSVPLPASQLPSGFPFEVAGPNVRACHATLQPAYVRRSIDQPIDRLTHRPFGLFIRCQCLPCRIMPLRPCQSAGSEPFSFDTCIRHLRPVSEPVVPRVGRFDETVMLSWVVGRCGLCWLGAFCAQKIWGRFDVT